MDQNMDRIVFASRGDIEDLMMEIAKAVPELGKTGASAENPQLTSLWRCLSVMHMNW